MCWILMILVAIRLMGYFFAYYSLSSITFVIMKFIISISFVLSSFIGTYAQSLYFPPLVGNTWETMDPAALNWCQPKIDVMLNYLQQQDSKAFIVLKDGKIVIEKYFGSFTQDSLWYWASAGKSLTSVLVGIAQESGNLHIDSASSKYMGAGWTSLTPQQERAITVKHQLSMTTGLDDTGVLDCTDASCLTYMAAPGTRWSYHNAPYTLLDSVMENATNMSLNQFHQQKIKSKTGMNGLYVKVGYNNVYFSNARSMARFGLLMLNKGKWNNQTVLGDTAYYNDMIHSSQNLNLSYGYLWWLNGQSSYMLPQSQFVVNGPAVPNAPNDMFAALGKNGQVINVVPSENLVLIRMGNPPTSPSAFIGNIFNNEIWGYMNDLECESGVIENNKYVVKIFPNPASDVLYIGDGNTVYDKIIISDVQGKEILSENNASNISISSLNNGMYFLNAVKDNQVVASPFVKK